GGWRESADVWSLGPGDSAWRAEPPLQSARGALGLAALGDTLVVFGGVAGGSPVATAEQLRAGAPRWQPAPAMREVREHLAATSVGGRVYAIAGRAGAMETNRRTVESWDGDEAAWREEPPLNDTRGGTAAAGTCVAGGEEPAGTIATVECLVVEGDDARWEVVARLETPRHGLAVVAVGDAIHVIGGGPTPGLSVSGAHEVLTPDR
ncbi:MAG TPA: hypothetical protein VF230_00025, partial [Acidimicrobiales bacterium]